MYINDIVKQIKPSDIRVIALEISKYKDGVNLSIGEPEPDIPYSVLEKMREALLNENLGYCATGGIPELRSEYARYYNEVYEANYDASECLVNVGATESFSSFFRTVLKEGDEVILNIPVYTGYGPNILLQKATPIYVDNSENDYKITAKKLEEAITDKTKVIVITQPNNPTGQIISLEEMDKIAKLIEKHDIYLMVDEIYSALSFEKFYSFARYHHLKDKIVIVTGFSKSHSMTGFRVGITLASKTLIQNIVKMTQYTVTGAPTISQIGAIEALKNHRDRSEITSRYKMKMDYLYDNLTQLGFDCIKPQGGICMYVRYSNIFSKKSLELALDLIDKVRIGVVPASAFHDEYAFRLTVGTSFENIKEFVRRMKIYMNLEEIYLAGGCFWGVEAYFKRIPGIVKTSVGYANGKTQDTSYENLKNTDHVETVHIVYDKTKISLDKILEKLYDVIDPTSINKQGADEGRQYRTGIYYKDLKMKELIQNSLNNLEKRIGKKVVVENELLNHYILAEDYHQDYLTKNPNGYCHIKL